MCFSSRCEIQDRGAQRKDASECSAHNPVSLQPSVSAWLWKGATFQPGASLQLNNFCSQKNKAALGSCARRESKAAPRAVSDAMWGWGCWNCPCIQRELQNRGKGLSLPAPRKQLPFLLSTLSWAASAHGKSRGWRWQELGFDLQGLSKKHLHSERASRGKAPPHPLELPSTWSLRRPPRSVLW